MIRLYYFFFLSLISIFGVSQNTFKMIFSGPGYDSGIAAFRTHDKGYLIVGNTASYGHGGSDIWVIALDSNADFLWQKTYGGIGNEEATKAIINSNDELYITGKTMSASSFTVNIFVLRLSKTGVPIFMNTYGGQDWDFANSLSFQNDSTILVCGKTFNGPNSGYYDPFVMAIKSNGDTLWTSYGGSGGEEDYQDIVTAENNKIYIAGSSLLSNHDVDTAFIKCLDENGNMLWQTNLHYKTRSQFMSLTLTSDSNITATGFRMDTTNTFREPFLAKISRDGNWVWIRNGAQASDAYFSYIEEESSGNLVIAGVTTAFGFFGESMYNAIFSPDGWYFDASTCGGYMDDNSVMNSFYDFDSTYLAVGTTKSFHVPMSGILLVQMNKAMNYDTTTRIIVVSHLEDMHKQPFIVDVFPNPTNDFIHLSFVSDINEEGIIRILDMKGKEVLNQVHPLGKREDRMDISHLAGGIYLLQMESKSYKFTTKIIKQ